MPLAQRLSPQGSHGIRRPGRGPALPGRRGAGTLASAALLAGVIGLVATAASAQGDLRLVGTWQSVANADDVRALARDGQRLWVGSASGGVAVWEGEKLVARYLSPQDGLPCNDVRDIVLWRGVWWFATCRGVAVFDPGRNRMEAVPAELASDDVTALAVDAADRLWVASAPEWDPSTSPPGAEIPGTWRGGGLVVTADGRSWQPVPGSEAWPSRNPRDMAVWNGQMWVAAMPHFEWEAPSRNPGGSQTGHWLTRGGGVGRFAAGTWTVYDADSEAAVGSAASALAAAGDALWVGTVGRGLAAFDGGSWTGYRDCGNPRRCIADNYVGAVAVGPDGAVWVATRRFNGRGTGVAVLDTAGTPASTGDDAWHEYGVGDGLPAEGIGAILPEADGSVWLGTAHIDPSGFSHGAGLAHLLADRATVRVLSTVVGTPGEPADNVVTTLAWDSGRGSLWVGTAGGGLSVFGPDGAWRTFTRQNTGGGLGSDSIADVAVAADGGLWVATRQLTYDGREWVDGGLSRLVDGAWTRFTEDNGLPSNNLSAVALDGRGKVWVGTGATAFGPKEERFRGQGLAVLDAATGAWERTFAFPTLTSNNITDIGVRDGEVWVSTAYFFYVDPRPRGAQFHIGGGLSAYNLGTGRWRNYTAEDGLTPSVRPRGLGSTKPLLDLRSLLLEPEAGGGVRAGGAAYPDATFKEGIRPDGILDILDGGDVRSVRFDASGAVTAVRGDGAGRVWVTTDGGGLHVRADGEWIEAGPPVGRAPFAALTDVAATGPEVWLGSAGGGLARLVPPPAAVPTDPAMPTPTRVVVARLPHRLFVPRVLRERLPLPIRLPDASTGTR